MRPVAMPWIRRRTALTSFPPLSIYVLNLNIGIGLGLSIDYSLFMVSRYREELSHGLTPVC